MLEQIQYINHMGEVINFGQEGIYVNESDLHDFAWNITKKNDKISAITMGVVKRSIPVVIYCSDVDEGFAKRDRLFEVCEKDVLAMEYGKLIIGDYYLKCYVTGSKSKQYQDCRNSVNITLTVQTDKGQWIKETTSSFGYGSGGTGGNLDYNNDFAYDYTSTLNRKQLNNTGFVASNFRLTIYGACENPSVTIGGHEYQVNVSQESGEYLTIDSVAKTIIQTDSTGGTVNCFNLRNRNSYIFEKIPVGLNNVSSNGEFKFSVTLLEERSAPKWI